MPLSLVALATAASFACVNPSHHDGDNLRCSNVPGSMRLQGIDAPELPGACRPGRRCVDGDPYAARDQLRRLTRGKQVSCTQEDTDHYGRAIVNCEADGVNLSCAMIASGHAVPRYAPIDCSRSMAGAEAPATPAPQTSVAPPVPAQPPVFAPDDTSDPAPTRAAVLAQFISPVWLVMAALLGINAITWLLFAIDKRRAVAGHSHARIAEKTLLGWAAMGGSPAAWHAINRLRHKSAKDRFKQPLLIITGLQIGMLLGGAYWWLAG